MKDDMSIYWYLFQHDPTALNALDLYQRKHYGCHIEKPENPKQKPIEIPVEETSEELERLMQQPPSAKGHGGY